MVTAALPPPPNPGDQKMTMNRYGQGLRPWNGGAFTDEMKSVFDRFFGEAGNEAAADPGELGASGFSTAGPIAGSGARRNRSRHPAAAPPPMRHHDGLRIASRAVLFETRCAWNSRTTTRPWASSRARAR